MGFFEENWFWRGTQSAIFYYISCSPWIEWKYKRKRRNEANRAQKQREEVIATQPGQVQQPGAFQTNEAWVEEILMGPGPPKGWKRDSIADKIGSLTERPYSGIATQNPDGTAELAGQVMVESAIAPENIEPAHGAAYLATVQKMETGTDTAAAESTLQPVNTTSLRQSTDSSSSSSLPTTREPRSRSRPSLERRLSTAMDNLRDTIRSTMRPENWNWIRYERDDEILSGFNQRMTDMWNRATNFASAEKEPSSDDDAPEASQRQTRRKRAYTEDSDRFDYEKYARNPEVNELHPPVVSRLPATRDDAAWMVLPPPSAAVMAGKTRPKDEPGMRWPLARIGRTLEDWQKLSKTPSTEQARGGNAQIESIPELSDSFTEASTSDEEVWHTHVKRHSAPAAEANKPAELGLMYVNSRQVMQDRPGLHSDTM